MKIYFLFNTAININGKWFLPFEQYEVIDEVEMEMVNHTTRSGWPITAKKILQTHYTIERDGIEYNIPYQAGGLTDVKIPEEWSNRHKIWYDKNSDGIKDYIKAAQEYLNIEIRFRPETSNWYRSQFPKTPEERKVGAKPSKTTEDANRENIPER